MISIISNKFGCLKQVSASTKNNAQRIPLQSALAEGKIIRNIRLSDVLNDVQVGGWLPWKGKDLRRVGITFGDCVKCFAQSFVFFSIELGELYHDAETSNHNSIRTFWHSAITAISVDDIRTRKRHSTADLDYNRRFVDIFHIEKEEPLP